MQSSSLAQAKKHIQIAIKLKRIVRECHPDWLVYLATYTANQLYQDVELESGAQFWSIRGYSGTPSRSSHVKNPDALIIQRGAVRFLIEIKWGAVEETGATDVPCTQFELMGLASTLHEVAVCRVRGPAVQAGVRHRSATFPVHRDYPVSTDGQVLLVADFRAMQRILPGSYQEMLQAWERAGRSPRLADIAEGTREVSGVKVLLSG